MSMRLAVAWVAIVALLGGCSQASMIPMHQLDRDVYRKPGSYRIKLHGWNEYNARRFSVTDSTVVIEELHVTDDHYKRTKHDMPIVIPLEDVEYVGQMETNWLGTSFAVVGIAAIVVFFYALSHSDEFGY